MKVIDVIPLAESTNYAPICIRHCEPLAISRPDIDINGTKVVVLLMAGCSATRDLQKYKRCLLRKYRLNRRSYSAPIDKEYILTSKCNYPQNSRQINLTFDKLYVFVKLELKF